MSTRHENPKHSQADGAGFNRLRAAQKQREEFASICQRSHPSCDVYIDQVREYAGAQVVFYRACHKSSGMVAFEHARIAVFKWVAMTSTRAAHWSKDSDIIAAQG